MLDRVQRLVERLRSGGVVTLGHQRLGLVVSDEGPALCPGAVARARRAPR
jgi:hypothetical protein